MDDDLKKEPIFISQEYAEKEFFSVSFKEDMRREHGIIHSEYLMYCNVLAVIMGFTIIITTYLVTIVGDNWENDFSPILGLFFLSFCCTYGLTYFIRDFKFTNKITSEMIRFVQMNSELERKL